MQYMHYLSSSASGFYTVMKLILYAAFFLFFVPSVYANNKYAVVDSVYNLKAKEPQVRSYAADELAKSKNPYAVAPLISALEDAEARVRIAVAHALGEIGDKRAVKPLISALKNKDPNVRVAVANALGMIGDKGAVQPLISCLQDEDPHVRGAVARALGKTSDPDAVEQLILSLQDKEKGVREAAAEALGEMKDARGVLPLISALRDHEERVRFRSASSLGEIKDRQAIGPLISILKNGSPSDKFSAASALGEIKDARAVEPLISALKDKAAGARRAAAVALINIQGIQALSFLKDVLKDKDDYVRVTVLSALGKLDDNPVVEILIAALSDTSAVIRASAAKLLGKKKESRAVKPLIACLDDKEEFVVKSAIEALGMIGASSVEPLLETLKDKKNNIRSAALSAVGATKDPKAFRLLLEALSDDDKKVREDARRAFIEIGAQAVEFLIGALYDGPPGIQKEIISLLEEIRDVRAVAPLKELSKSADKALSEYAEFASERIAIPQITIIDSLVVISTSQYDIDHDGKKEIIEIIMTDGEKINYDDPWCGGGARWEGGFSIRVRKGKRVLSEQSLNELIEGSDFPHSLSFWHPEFGLVLKDYNNDGQIDFNIGQYGTCAGNNYFLFTVRKDGKIQRLPVHSIEKGIFVEAFHDNSTNQIHAKKGTISTRSFDDGYMTNTYKWNGKVFIWVGQKQTRRQ